MIQSILFDLDGTLIDPKVGITESIRYAMAGMKRPLPPEADLDWCIGPPLQQNFARLLQTSDPDEINTAVTHFRVRFSGRGLFEATVYEGVPPMLAQLHETGFSLFLATSKPRIYASQIVSHFQLSAFLDAIYGSELDGRLASKTDLIQHIIQQEKLNPQETLMIGDREHDIMGARANHVWAGGVTYGFGQQKELIAAGADKLFHTPTAVQEIHPALF